MGLSRVSGSWNIAPISLPRRRRISGAGRLSMRRPPSTMRPPAMWPGGSKRPMMAAPVSDLPAPDSPTTPSTSPGAMAKETPSTAVTSPRRVAKAMRRFSTCNSGLRSDAMAARRGAIDAQARIDGVVEEIDDEIDDDEEEGDKHEIGRHHGNVGEADRLDDEKPHAGPLEHRLGDDGKGDDRAQLQPGDGDDRHERVLQRVAEMDEAVRQAAGAREFDVVGAQHLQHLGADEADDQRHLEEAEGDRRQDEGLQPVDGEEPRRPPTERNGAAAAEGRKPAQDHGEHQDEQDAGEEGRERDADKRRRQHELGEPGVSVQTSIDADRQADGEGEDGGDEAELEGRRQALGDELGDRARILVGEAEIALGGMADEARELQDEGVVEAELVAKLLALPQTGILADDVVDGIADIGEEREGDEGHRQHHGHGLAKAANDEGDHGAAPCARRRRPLFPAPPQKALSPPGRGQGEGESAGNSVLTIRNRAGGSTPHPPRFAGLLPLRQREREKERNEANISTARYFTRT